VSLCDINLNYLTCCDRFFGGNDIFTYSHETLGHKSWIDHFFVTRGLEKYLSLFDVIDVCDNFSDHLPIICSLSFDCNVTGCDCDSIKLPAYSVHYTDRWNKADIMLYYHLSGCYLQQITILKDILCHENNCNTKEMTDNYYEAIVHALKKASSESVPKIKHSVLKSYWNEELDDLKQQSIDWHKLWAECGKPRCGVVNNIRLRIKYKYKHAIHAAASNFEQQHADELLQFWLDKKPSDFWKCWNSKYKKTNGC